ncbi:MAG TPA: bacteriohemerythrin [Candidatus Sulfotelmatobacter sp.]|jgi:hemerythrin|nr:bacteriohemerythrin [Candidatus Sulfotelmatobacter sp.]
MHPEDVTIKWTDELSVGIPSLDDDHKILVDLLNSTLVACYAGFGDEHVGIILEELFKYTQIHFNREMSLLRISGYDQCDLHEAEHQRIYAEVEQMAQRARAEADQGLSQDVADFLKNWLFTHIMEHDRRYAAHLQKTHL